MASTSHRATAEQWQRVEAIALLTTSGPSVPAAVLELRSRIEALEAAQRTTAMNQGRAASTEARPATDEPTDRELRELFWPGPEGHESLAVGLRRVYRAGMAAAVCPHVVSSDEGTSYCGLAAER